MRRSATAAAATLPLIVAVAHSFGTHIQDELMSRYVTLLASIEQNGKNFMVEQRNALRTAYMQAKGSTKMHGWTVNDDHSFEAIDLMVANLATDAGFKMAPPPSAPPMPGTQVRPVLPVRDQTQA